MRKPTRKEVIERLKAGEALAFLIGTERATIPSVEHAYNLVAEYGKACVWALELLGVPQEERAAAVYKISEALEANASNTPFSGEVH